MRDALAKKSSMVISQMLGGLGNQMFQYAAGRALSLATEQPLLLDLRSFKSYKLHNGFEINHAFNAPVNSAAEFDLHRLLGWRAYELPLRVLRRVESSLLRGKNLVIEPHFNYWGGFSKIRKPSYLTGYWQSEKYFTDYEDVIRSDFSFKRPLDSENRKISSHIQSYNSVSLHVRRGDYVTHAATSKILNTCSVDYYQHAIQYIAERVTSPYFYIFSDNIQWVRDNIHIPFAAEYIDHNHGRNSFIDMHLMSLCKHHIIANSSFSWWGAWLNDNPNKLVVVPRKWFVNNTNDQDLVPEKWVRL